jgi:hypothetical protein
MPILRLDQQRKRIKVAEFEIENPIVFEFFDSRSEADRDELLKRAIHIGVLALAEERLQAFFARTENELGTHLESLKLIFELRRQQFFETTQKGAAAEEDVAAVLREFVVRRKWNDKVELTGTTTGKLKKNKTGDLVCSLNGLRFATPPSGFKSTLQSAIQRLAASVLMPLNRGLSSM